MKDRRERREVDGRDRWGGRVMSVGDDPKVLI